MQGVDGEKLEFGGKGYGGGHHACEYAACRDQRDNEYCRELVPSGYSPPYCPDHRHGWNYEQVELVDAERKSEDICYQYQYAPRRLHRLGARPLHHEPERERCQEYRHGIDLGFDCGIPYRVAPSEGERADRRSSGGYYEVEASSRSGARKDPEGSDIDHAGKEISGKGGEKSACEIDGKRRQPVGNEHRRHAHGEHPHGIARGVSDFETRGGGDVFRTVPV